MGIEIDNRLNFKIHIHQLVKRAGGQLNFLIRNRKYLNYDAKKVVIESFILANFNYCSLVWHFCSSESMKKLERIQERAFRFLFEDYNSDYDQLLTKINKTTIHHLPCLGGVIHFVCLKMTPAMDFVDTLITLML